MKQTLKLKNLSCQNCVKHVTNHLLDLEQYQEVLDDTIYEVEELV